MFVGAQCVDESTVYPFTYNGTNYEVVKTKKSWANAAACAVERGGFLVEINSQEEQDAVFNSITTGALVSNGYGNVDCGGGISYVWLGGNDIGRESNWQWYDSDQSFWSGQGQAGSGNGQITNSSFVNWGGKSTGNIQEPDNFTYPGYCNTDQDGLGLALANWPYGITGEWNDIQAGSLLYFVIEYPQGTGENVIHKNSGWNISRLQNSYSIFSKETTAIQLYNMAGQLVYSNQIQAQQVLNINSENYPAGIYSLIMQSSNAQSAIKLIVE